MRTYDDADRLLSIEHRDAGTPYNVLMRIEYEWNGDNTVASRTETDNTGPAAVVVLVTMVTKHEWKWK